MPQPVLRWLAGLLMLVSGLEAAAEDSVDLVVYGGNAAGVAAAVQAARLGASVVLLEPGPALGGLTAGGLGATDVGDKRMVGGLAREFYRRIHDHYASAGAWSRESRADYLPRHPLNVTEATRQFWFFEPHVATRILEDLLREAKVVVHRRARLDRANGVRRTGTRLTALTLLDGRTFRAPVFIDATYEGDLLAAAGVTFALGREANRQYGETLNGIRFSNESRTAAVDPYVRPGDPASGLLPRIAARAPGAEGEADSGVQAYNFRVCLTDVPENRLPFERPARYNPLEYELLLRSLQGRTAAPGPQLFTLTPMPNRKTDTNNRELFSTDYVGRSHGWAAASYEERDWLWQEHKDYTQGMFWFLAHDPRVPEETRRAVGRWGLARDEFPETGHWPFQLYVREARRLVGEYVITEHDARRRTTVPDPVAFASYALDSHAVGMFVDSAGKLRLEGTFFENIRAFPLSYRALVPRRGECTNLLVPVCLSASHAAYGSIRMEPVFLMLGQAAGAAAVLARRAGCDVQELPYATLRDRLLQDGAVLAVPRLVAPESAATGPASEAAIAAINRLHGAGFFATAEASVSAWRNAARPGAASEAWRSVGLIIAAAQRFDRLCASLTDATRILATRGCRLDNAYWVAREDPAATARGEAVAELLVALAAAFP
ncbi:MAG: FAD-dependent oxidoreductase [Verrucomicrobia bacterium]|nr:FAD-dependent oxidoreductase [Verrucomicrobiota bacterium]